MSFMEHVNWNALCGICMKKDSDNSNNNNNIKDKNGTYTNVALVENGNSEMYQQNHRQEFNEDNAMLKPDKMTRSNVSGYRTISKNSKTQNFVICIKFF